MYQKILAPLDGSELSECSLQHVKAIAAGCPVEAQSAHKIADKRAVYYHEPTTYGTNSVFSGTKRSSTEHIDENSDHISAQTEPDKTPGKFGRI